MPTDELVACGHVCHVLGLWRPSIWSIRLPLFRFKVSSALFSRAVYEQPSVYDVRRQVFDATLVPGESYGLDTAKRRSLVYLSTAPGR